MPDYQMTFNGSRATPTAASVLCAGGCERRLSTDSLILVAGGYMCPSCFDDLYIVCYECDAHMRIDEYGECDELHTAPDGTQRCRACAERIYSRCCACGRMTLRAAGEVRMSPEDASEGEYCASCWDSTWFECIACGVIEASEDRHNDLEQRSICLNCFNAQYTPCSACNCTLIRGEHHGWEGDPYCERCYGRADTWKVQPWSGVATSFDKVGSERRFGVELETCDCDNWRDLHGETEWGCVYECSTSGREFISPILQGDEGFHEIRTMCDTADEKGWTVDSACGLHIHLDVSDESTEACLRIAYAYRRTYTLWKALVPSHRRDNSMCGSPQYSCADIRTFEHIEDFAELRDRFEFANWRSYIKHGSFEIRVYPGTLNSREICAWIAIHARFIDAVKAMSYDEIDSKIGAQVRTNWRGMCNIIDDSDLLDYWRRKASNMGTELAAYGYPEPEATLRLPTVDPPSGTARLAILRDLTDAQAALRLPTVDPPVYSAPPAAILRDLTDAEATYPAPPAAILRDLTDAEDCPCRECVERQSTGVYTVSTGGRFYSLINEAAVADNSVSLARFRGRRIYYDDADQRFIVPQ